MFYVRYIAGSERDYEDIPRCKGPGPGESDHKAGRGPWTDWGERGRKEYDYKGTGRRTYAGGGTDFFFGAGLWKGKHQPGP